jgi:serine/threonine protein kinase
MLWFMFVSLSVVVRSPTKRRAGTEADIPFSNRNPCPLHGHHDAVAPAGTCPGAVCSAPRPAAHLPMPTPRDAETENDREQRLLRLGQAMDAFLRFRRGDAGADRERFLRDHENLRDLLVPMFDDDGDADVTDAAAGDTDPQQAFQPAPGRQLGDYRLVREIGRGGMGVVWEAEQISLRRRVALKLLPEHLSQSPQSIERFRREAAAASRLRHPGLVPIHEVGEWHGVHFFSMEFVEGRTLHVVMQQERFGVRADCSRTAEAAEVTARLADALHHAHEHGLVHRDVKPHNVMVGHDGSVRLLDFGLAKDLDARTQSGGAEFFGTPHYCSPEQITGQTTIGPAADVFSLGIVLYELLARRRPFDGESSRIVLRRIETGEFPSLRSVAPSVPRDLQTICHKALEPRPQDRYPTPARSRPTCAASCASSRSTRPRRTC